MTSPLKKVRKGDPLTFPAAAFNAFVDAAVDFQKRQGSGGGHFRPGFRQAGIVRVKNASGADRDRFDILGISAPIFTPADSEDTFKNQVALTGVVPDEDYHVGKFVILLEPVPDGKVGLACLDGVCPVKLDVQDQDHGYADIAGGQAGKLRSSSRGATQILWKESGAGEKWAVVRMGSPPPFEVVRFAGVCKIDEANPGEKYPGANVAENQADSYGNPIDREWLLVKCERPFESSTDADPGQEAHFPMLLDVTMGGASKYWWEYYLITEDFEVSGDDCATWNTKPTMEWGTDGLIDSNFGLSATLSSAGRHLSCCYPGFGYARTVYGICLRPYLWYLGGTSSSSTHEVDYRKWLVRL